MPSCDITPTPNSRLEPLTGLFSLANSNYKCGSRVSQSTDWPRGTEVVTKVRDDRSGLLTGKSSTEPLNPGDKGSFRRKALKDSSGGELNRKQKGMLQQPRRQAGRPAGSRSLHSTNGRNLKVAAKQGQRFANKGWALCQLKPTWRTVLRKSEVSVDHHPREII